VPAIQPNTGVTKGSLGQGAEDAVQAGTKGLNGSSSGSTREAARTPLHACTSGPTGGGGAAAAAAASPTARTSKEEGALRASPFLRALVSASGATQEDCTVLLKQLAPQAPAFLQQLSQQQQRSASSSSSSSSGDAARADTAALSVAVRACASCLQRAFDPVLAHVERVLSHGAASTAAAGRGRGGVGGAPEWATVSAPQVMCLLVLPLSVAWSAHCRQCTCAAPPLGACTDDEVDNGRGWHAAFRA